MERTDPTNAQWRGELFTGMSLRCFREFLEYQQKKKWIPVVTQFHHQKGLNKFHEGENLIGGLWNLLNYHLLPSLAHNQHNHYISICLIIKRTTCPHRSALLERAEVQGSGSHCVCSALACCQISMCLIHGFRGEALWDGVKLHTAAANPHWGRPPYGCPVSDRRFVEVHVRLSGREWGPSAR